MINEFVSCYQIFVISGAVKLTPAHDYNDFEVGKRHNLELRTVIDDYGFMTNAPEPFQVNKSPF